MRRITVLVKASDPLVHAGIGAMLSACAQIDVLGEAARDDADVVVLAERVVSAGRLHAIIQRGAGKNAAWVVVTDRFDAGSVLPAVRMGVKSILSASRATESRLAAAVLGVTRGISLLPADLQAVLLRELDEMRSTVLEANGLSLALLDARERDVLGSIADGKNVDEIATRIGCPEGTIRKTLSRMMRRLNLNNHSHAVAYSFRSGALT
ncbi:response regulator transcription factor [Lentzea sp. NPDC102401]|uniref:response regulator transcription factor n=1 Tax=Lentzea sp. NPDC102401 TaxID=3364128 RepID=UPI0037FD36DE